LEETSFNEFKQEFASFDQAIKDAGSLKKKYERDYPQQVFLPIIFHYLPVPAIFLFVMGSPAGAMAGGLEDMAIKSFEFGDLGRADVYELSDKITLADFFQEKGLPVPEKLERFLDRPIAVFRIYNPNYNIGALVRFEFENSKEIFYPASTTELWQGLPEEYAIRVKAPKDYKLSPNIKANLEINDVQNQYLLFSPSCMGLSGIELMQCGQYSYSYGKEEDPNEFKEKLASSPNLSHLLALYDTDLEIGVEPERKPIPIGTWAASGRI